MQYLRENVQDIEQMFHYADISLDKLNKYFLLVIFYCNYLLFPC